MISKLAITCAFVSAALNASTLSLVPHKYRMSNEEFQLMKDLFSPDCFVETGTFRGYSTSVAATYFPSVKTIELSFEVYEDTKARLSPIYPNIEFFQGNSADVLPVIAKSLNSKALFFLDAHFCFQESAKAFNDPPLLGELEGVLQNGPKDSVILIDDIRVFANNQRLPFDAYDYYPSIPTVYQFVKKIAPQMDFYFIGDEAIIFDPTYHPIEVSSLVKAITKSIVTTDINQIVEADKYLIERSTDTDIQELLALYDLFDDRSLISFWLGLSYMNRDSEKALAYFDKALRSGFYHERIYAYQAKLKKKADYPYAKVHEDGQKFLKAFPQSKRLLRQIMRS